MPDSPLAPLRCGASSTDLAKPLGSFKRRSYRLLTLPAVAFHAATRRREALALLAADPGLMPGKLWERTRTGLASSPNIQMHYTRYPPYPRHYAHSVGVGNGTVAVPHADVSGLG